MKSIAPITVMVVILFAVPLDLAAMEAEQANPSPTAQLWSTLDLWYRTQTSIDKLQNDPEQNTIDHYFNLCDLQDCVKLCSSRVADLVKQGAQINPTEPFTNDLAYQKAPLYYALSHHMPLLGMVQTLLKAGADVTVADADLKMTPLHEAVIKATHAITPYAQEWQEIVEALIQADSKKTFPQDWAGRTAYDLTNKAEIRELLKSHGFASGIQKATKRRKK